MVILLKQHAPQAEQERLLAWLRELGAEVRVTGTPERPFFCLTGDISRIDPSLAARFPAVEDVLRLTEPYPLCSRRLHPEPTVVSVGGARFGGGHFGLIAGPCAVESEEQIFTAALYELQVPPRDCHVASLLAMTIGGPAGKGRRRLPAARRGIQAAHLSL